MRNTRAQTLGALPFQVDTSSRDYVGIRDSLISFIQDIAPEWTDRSSSDAGMVLLECMSYVADVLHYQLDRTQNESYLTTAQERINVQQLLRLINYELSPGTGASVPFCVITDQDNVTIPALTKITTSASDVGFEITEAILLPTAGIYCPSSVRTVVEDGLQLPATPKDTLVGSYGLTVTEVVGISDGTSFQTFDLSQSPVSLSSNTSSSLSVITSDGTVFTSAVNFLDAESDSTVFVYQVLEAGSLRIKFGDGISGQIPSLNSSITVSYRVGTGALSNSYGVNSLTKMSPKPSGVVSVFNPVQPSGGRNEETLADAKTNGPLSLRALDRAVTLQDFETLAVMTPGGGVKSARASAEDPYDVTVYISAEGLNPIPTGVWFPYMDTGTGLIGAVGRWLSTKKPVATRLNVKAPVAVTPMLRAQITCFPNILQSEAKILVSENLLSLFASVSELFGKGIPISRIIQVIENTRGVDFVNIFEFRRDPSLYLLNGQDNQIVGSDIEVTAISTDVSYGRYKINWLNRLQYTLDVAGYGKIRSSFNSERALIFTVDTVNTVYWYSSVSNSDVASRTKQFDIEITIGNVDPSGGSVWGFTVDNYAGNMNLESGEIIVPPMSATGLLNTDFVQILALGGI